MPKSSLRFLNGSKRPMTGGTSSTWRFALATAVIVLVVSAQLALGQATPAEVRAMAKSHTDALSTIPVPSSPPGQFKQFVQNASALKVLGKALFWDQQLGSDGQSCASCHFHGGADNRSRNQIDPGIRGNDTKFSAELGGAPNHQLVTGDFPFFSGPEGTPSRNINDIASSQGVYGMNFAGIRAPNDPNFPYDVPGTTTANAAIFTTPSHVIVRNVEPRNTPTVINAAFNHRNFWDGRARNEFNGVSPFGDLDPTAKVVRVVASGPKFQSISVTNTSTGSQADGPPLSDMEMSFAGRQFFQLGRKMLSTTAPLRYQDIDITDSLLGGLCCKLGGGLNTTYQQLIESSFTPEWWSAPGWVVDVTNPAKPVLVKGTTGPNRYTVEEYNFSLFFGFAVAEYEKLLIAGQSPFDKFMLGNDATLSPSAQNGLVLFVTKGKCISCHSGPEFTNASVRNVQNFEVLERMIMGDDRVAVYDNGFYNTGVRPETEDIGVGGTAPSGKPLSNSRLFQNCVKNAMASNPALTAAQANSSCSVPRILARPGEAAVLLTKAVALLPDSDPNKAAATALINDAQAAMLLVPPDVFTASCKLAANAVMGCTTPGAVDLLIATLGTSQPLIVAAQTLLPDQSSPGTAPNLLGPPLQPQERVAVDGAFKAATIRNTEVSAPFFHNGGTLSLEDVVRFYNRGGDFAQTNQDNLDPAIQPLGLMDSEVADLVAFIKSTTDPRVANESMPFDHPSLTVPNGGTTVSPMSLSELFGVNVGGNSYTTSGTCNPATTTCYADDRVKVTAVGAAGRPPAQALGNAGTPQANFPDSLQ